MPLPSSPALAADLAALADSLRARTVAVHVGTPTRRGPTPSGQGSGIVWQADGLIVTNAHVARTDHVFVTLPDERRVAARVVARDPARDLALLSVDIDGLTPATPASPTTLAPGTLVFAFGHPLGHANALAAGILHATSATAPAWISASGPRPRVEIVQADVRLRPGNSGGPLADAAGRVLGVNAMVVGGLGVAISANEVDRFVRRSQHQASRPTLGIRLRPVTVRTRTPATERSALLVLDVNVDSAARRATLLPGDVLLAAAGRPLYTPDDLADALAAAVAGTLTLDVARAGRGLTLQVALDGPAPSAAPGAAPSAARRAA